MRKSLVVDVSVHITRAGIGPYRTCMAMKAAHLVVDETVHVVLSAVFRIADLKYIRQA